ncbi:MAG TPA: hypothetical protein VF500_28040, partial [Mucilaginibacter sp.]
MKMSNRYLLLLFALIFSFHSNLHAQKPSKKITIITLPKHHARISYGVQKLTIALQRAGYSVTEQSYKGVLPSGNAIVVGLLADAPVKKLAGAANNRPGKEGFIISDNGLKNKLLIAGADNSGALYGCLELADRISLNKKLPVNINLHDQPEMVLRGTCIGVQKPALLPGRGTYEYPYTPQNFPWFYDKALWIRYLDSLAHNRMNSLYLWNGHPFASLVRVKEYPYAVEVDDTTFKKNEEIYSFLADEADKRGIWLIQGFYNIIVSKPFAEKNNLKTQDRNRHI